MSSPIEDYALIGDGQTAALVGLLFEEYNRPGKHLAGNFPQALTHLTIVNTALGLSGRVRHRGGG